MIATETPTTTIPGTTTPTTWELWGGGGDTYGFPPTDWKSAVGNIAEHVLWYCLGGKEWREPLLKAIAPLETADPAAWLEAEAALNELVLETAHAAGIIGFCLARTWPGHLEDVADWPARALAHAGAIQRFTTTGEEDAR